MTPEHIQELLDKDPFEPFVIKLTNGDVHVVQIPDTVALMGTRIFVAFPNDKWAFIPLPRVASVESLQAA